MLYWFGQVHATVLSHGMRITSIFNTQHLAARHNGKLAQHIKNCQGTSTLIPLIMFIIIVFSFQNSLKN